MKRRNTGFSLLEVIVALAVLSLCVTVLMRIFSSVSGAARIADDYYQAIQIAESRMALLIAEEHRQGTRSGRVDDYFRWESRVSKFRPDNDNPIVTPSDMNDPLSLFTAYQFDVTVTWGNLRKRAYTLSTIRLGTNQ